MRRLPACLRFGRPAVHRLPPLHRLDPHGAAGPPHERRAARGRAVRPRAEPIIARPAHSSSSRAAGAGASPTTTSGRAHAGGKLLRPMHRRREQLLDAAAVEPVGGGVQLAAQRVGHRQHRRADRARRRAARTISDGAVQSGSPRACTSALATDAPTRRPVKLPGPSLSTRPVTSSSVTPGVAQRVGDHRQEPRRVPPGPGELALDQRRAVHRAPPRHGRSRSRARDASERLESPPARVGQVVQPEAAGGCRQPGAGLLGPFDQDRVALGYAGPPNRDPPPRRASAGGSSRGGRPGRADPGSGAPARRSDWWRGRPRPAPARSPG